MSSGDMPPLATAVVPPEVTAGAFDCFLVKGRVVAYGLRLVLGEVRMPGANRLPLDFARALGDDMVACAILSSVLIFGWQKSNLDRYYQKSKIKSRWPPKNRI